MDATTQYSYNYFFLLNRLLVDACGGVGGHGAPLFQELLEVLLAKLRDHPVVEVSFTFLIRTSILTPLHQQQQTVVSGFKDNVLLGTLNLIRTLVLYNKAYKIVIGPASA